MEDQQPNPSNTPDAPPVAAPPIPLAPAEPSAFQSSQPITPPLADALPGDAANTPLIPLTEAPASPRVTIIRAPAAPAPAVGPAGGSFSLWALIWMVAWTGVMALTLNHRFDRKFDWNTSYFSIAARNLVHDGFAKLHGGVYLLAGQAPTAANGVREDFYAGHPPLTAWLLAGWMKIFNSTDDAVIRALPLAFTALNLLLLYALVKRIFGAPAALATTVIFSLLPMTAYYAQIVNMEPFVLTFMLGASLGYLGWARSASTFGFLFMSVCIVLGCWTDWPMYIFTGFLAISHFFRRRDLLTPLLRETASAEGEEDAKPGLPVLSSLFMIVLPMAVFAAFLIFQKLNGSTFDELGSRAKDRMHGGYAQLLDHIKHPKDWFIGLFTASALLLAALGLIFWTQWSRRLSLAGGEAGRRAGFRILLCMVLMQCVYTLAFPNGATVHEFWQYYLVVPIAILAGAFCTWLTVVGGAGRRFSLGFFDRAGWAVAASIPFLALGPVLYRLHIDLLGKAAPPGDSRLSDDYAGVLSKATKADDLILTDWAQEPGLGFALPWYTNRTILPFEGTGKDEHGEYNHDTRSIEGIQRIAADEKYKSRRILYLWSTDGPSDLEQNLNVKYPLQFEFGKAIVYLIQGTPDPTWKKAGIESSTAPNPAIPAPDVPTATKPTTTQATTIPIAPTTKPAP